MMKKYHITTFGCQMNKSDSERIAQVLDDIGFKVTDKQEGADLVVVNMCSVRQSAVDRVWGLEPKFKKIKKGNGEVKTVLTGCILKKDRRKLKEKFDYLIDIKDLPKLPRILNISLKRKGGDYLKIQPRYSDNSSVFIPISNGCNNFCSYCVVPYTRGPLICRDHKEIIKEVKKVTKSGAKEIWLLGQNVNDYQSPTNRSINFTKLFKMVNGIPGKFKLFLLSPNPKNFSGELIDTLANCEKFGKRLNLPVQSGDNEILKKMNRPYTALQYKNLVKKIRTKIPDINLSTDVIVGFPGETKKQFENTVELLKEIKFDMAYIAKYSPRPGTTAFKMKDNVSRQEKERRWKILNDILYESKTKN